MCRASCEGAPARALNNAATQSTTWKGKAGMVRRSMKRCESYSTAGGALMCTAVANKRRRRGVAHSVAIVWQLEARRCSVVPVPVLCDSSTTASPCYGHVQEWSMSRISRRFCGMNCARQMLISPSLLSVVSKRYVDSSMACQGVSPCHMKRVSLAGFMSRRWRRRQRGMCCPILRVAFRRGA